MPLNEIIGLASMQGRVITPSDVRWQCVRCTKSCGDTATHKRRILLLEDDVRRIEQTTGKIRDEFTTESELSFPYQLEMQKTDGGKCVFLKDGLCSIYAVRPLICQFYPFSLNQDQNGNLVFEIDSDCTGVKPASRSVTEAHYQTLVENARATFSKNNLLAKPVRNES